MVPIREGAGRTHSVRAPTAQRPALLRDPILHLSLCKALGREGWSTPLNRTHRASAGEDGAPGALLWTRYRRGRGHLVLPDW